jgi:MFS family permease
MWLLGLVIMIDQVDQNIVRGVVTPLQKDPRLHVTDLQIGLLLSCFVVVNGLITVPAGYLADRWNRSRTIGHTIIGWSGLTALTAASPNYGVLLGVRSALGFGQAITEPSAASLLGDFYSAEKRGLAFSVQQCLFFVGFALGIGLGGIVGNTLGWRWAFLLVGTPGVVIALFVYRLREPKRGESDRAHVGAHHLHDEPDEPLFEDGFRAFTRDMVGGLRADARTILGITTMRYALVGVASLLFTITAIAAAMPQFYERQLHVKTGSAEALVALLVLLGGIPGVLLGGRFADRYMTKIRGARMAIPAYCLFVGNALFAISYLRLPFKFAYPLEIVGFFIICMAIPALRAGLTDAVPANLRGSGFGFFNLTSVILGQGVSSLVVFPLAGAFGGNYRVAFLLMSPPVFIGAFILLRAREHLDADAAKIFEAIVTAMQEQQAREAEHEAARVHDHAADGSDSIEAGLDAGVGAGGGDEPDSVGTTAPP